jgi:hypothetical protein
MFLLFPAQIFLTFVVSVLGEGSLRAISGASGPLYTVRRHRIKSLLGAGHWWLMRVILNTHRRQRSGGTLVQSQPGQIVCKTLTRKNPSQKRAGGVAQGVGHKFKPQYCNNNNKKNTFLGDVSSTFLLQLIFTALSKEFVHDIHSWALARMGVCMHVYNCSCVCVHMYVGEGANPKFSQGYAAA